MDILFWDLDSHLSNFSAPATVKVGQVLTTGLIDDKLAMSF